jgi:hypothetical protein
MAMDHKSMKLLVAGLTALCGCAGMSREARQAPVERLDEHGVSAPLLEVDPGHALQFVNADARPHQIYSNDCGELSSAVLNPGATYAAEIGAGPKLCHFQDLLAPLATGYSGVIQVHDGQDPRASSEPSYRP